MFLKNQAGDEFQSETFKSIQASGSHFEDLRFSDCTFSKCIFSEAIFQKCLFTGCVFRSCNLDLAQIPGCSFRDVHFEKSRCTGLDWTQARWERKPWPGALHFIDSSVNHNTFMGLNLPRLVLRGCSAVEANFEEADLSNSDLRRTDFTRSRFFHTNLRGADLTGAKNYQISPEYNPFKKTRFSLPEALSLLYALDIELVDEPEDEGMVDESN